MSENRQPTQPNDDALSEPTEGHVDVDAAAQAHRGGPSEPFTGTGGAAGTTPTGTIPGAGLTDHDQPVEGGREEDEDEGVRGTGQEEVGTSF